MKQQQGIPTNELSVRPDSARFRRAAVRAKAGGDQFIRTKPVFSNHGLQRKCSCGGTPGPTGECEACKKKRLGLQTKLKINEPGDIYEQEADRIADQMLALPAHPASRDAPPRIQRLSGKSNGQIEPPASVNHALASPGRQLEPVLRQDMEQRFGYDFSRVRMHFGAAAEQSARDVNAHAYTVGSDVVFGAGRFAPETHEGRRLIAHELTHVVQQAGAEGIYCGRHDEKQTRSLPGTDLVVGRAEDPVWRYATTGTRSVGAESARPALSGGSPAPVVQLQRQPAPEAPTAEREATVPFVERIVISCKFMKLVLKTVGGDHVYRMQECKIPPGTYTANITHMGPLARLTIGKDKPFPLKVIVDRKHEQHDPALLLAGQDQVFVEVEDQPDTSAELEALEASDDPNKCLLEADNEDVIASASLDHDLFDHELEETTLWSQKIPLGFFANPVVKLKAGGKSRAKTSGGYGPGTLHDVCLLRVLDTKNMLQGHAKFTFPASINLFVDLDAWLKLAGDVKADYLPGVELELAAAEGKLHVHGSVALDAQLKIDTSVLYNLATRKYTLAGAAKADGYVSLGVEVHASVALTVLHFTLWHATWDWKPVDEGFPWKAGITIGKDLAVSFDEDQLHMAGAKAAPRGKKKRSRVADVISTLADVADEISTGIFSDSTRTLDKHHAQLENPDGSKKKPMPLIWYKPKRLYPNTMELPNVPEGESTTLYRDKPRPVPLPYGGDRGPGYRTYQFGVGKDYWPDEKKKQSLLYTKLPDAERVNQKHFRRVTERGGFNWKPFQADHVRDLQFDPQLDVFENLWPLDTTLNLQAGPRHQSQLDKTSQSLGKKDGYYVFIIDIRAP